MPSQRVDQFPDPIKQACAQFVRMARTIDVVQEVRLTDDMEDGRTIWTIIAAEPFDHSVREPISLAQQKIQQSFKDPTIDFRVQNLTEQPGQSPESLLPADATTLWRR